MRGRRRALWVCLVAGGWCWGQQVSVYGTTMAQEWKSDVPGFSTQTYTPATQFLGIDATDLGSENLSLHLYGWGTTDLGYVKASGAKSDGYLTYGYLDSRFNQANAELKAGRFSISQGGSWEQVDGLSGRTDLRGGFTFSFFAGLPVLYRPDDPVAAKDYAYQRDVIFGGRLGWRIQRLGEVGVFYVQDGSKSPKDLAVPEPVDYTRQQLGADIHLVPVSAVDFSGRTIFDVASHQNEPVVGGKPSRIAEHDYTMRVRLPGELTWSGNFAERNFYAYFAGTTMPNLFRQDENDKYRGYGTDLTWGQASGVQVVGNYKHTHRETYGDTNRYGADLRWAVTDAYLVGVGAHRTNATEALMVDPITPAFSLSNTEGRAWATYRGDKLTASADAIVYRFDDKKNPFLNGETTLYQLVGSLGYQVTPAVRVSGDLGFGTTAFAKHETTGLLRAEYRFGLGRKGGR